MWAVVRQDAALMNGNHSGYLERCGISLHLVPLSAALCRGMPYLAPGFPGGIWTDRSAFYRGSIRMKLHHDDDE